MRLLMFPRCVVAAPSQCKMCDVVSSVWIRPPPTYPSTTTYKMCFRGCVLWCIHGGYLESKFPRRRKLKFLLRRVCLLFFLVQFSFGPVASLMEHLFSKFSFKIHIISFVIISFIHYSIWGAIIFWKKFFFCENWRKWQSLGPPTQA